MPAMSPNDGLNGGQSYPCSFELIGAVRRWKTPNNL
jgi:hypothetical protein